MLTIRIAGEDDASAIARLMTGLSEAVGPEGDRPATPENTLVTPERASFRMRAMSVTETVLLCEADSEAVGLLSLRIQPYLAEDTPHAEVAELFVAPDHRGSRVAAVLMAGPERIARERGSGVLHVRAWHTNEEAHAFYHAVGYEPVEVCFEKQLRRE